MLIRVKCLAREMYDKVTPWEDANIKRIGAHLRFSGYFGTSKSPHVQQTFMWCLLGYEPEKILGDM